MEVNEAPEKIYLLKSQDRILDRWYNEQPIPKTFEQVEYIRTDAFIEKAYEYLSYHLDTSKIDVNYKFEFIEEFKKAMRV